MMSKKLYQFILIFLSMSSSYLIEGGQNRIQIRLNTDGYNEKFKITGVSISFYSSHLRNYISELEGECDITDCLYETHPRIEEFYASFEKAATKLGLKGGYKEKDFCYFLLEYPLQNSKTVKEIREAFADPCLAERVKEKNITYGIKYLLLRLDSATAGLINLENRKRAIEQQAEDRSCCTII